ncbi:uncharacterized protein LOC120347260 [Styela clava]|uniref:uncharacterized protein LOC120347260 n=1 Tax=Styela clava TaxID=7725 RepID=UPI001939F25F|nr:uncharacterized protein LOC120347260 [Styela clava]
MSALVRRLTKSLGSSLRRRAVSLRNAGTEAEHAVKQDDYMRNVKYPGLWVYAIFSLLAVREVMTDRKASRIIEEQRILALPLAERERPPDVKLLSSYLGWRYD